MFLVQSAKISSFFEIMRISRRTSRRESSCRRRDDETTTTTTARDERGARFWTQGIPKLESRAAPGHIGNLSKIDDDIMCVWPQYFARNKYTVHRHSSPSARNPASPPPPPLPPSSPPSPSINIIIVSFVCSRIKAGTPPSFLSLSLSLSSPLTWCTFHQKFVTQPRVT